MNLLIEWMCFVVAVLSLPFITGGFIPLAKARLQGRIGPPLFQPIYSLVRLLKKDETISNETSWIFTLAPVIILTASILLAFFTPWLSFRPQVNADDLFLVIYLFALIRFFAILASMDAGSPLCGFGGSREATLSLLTEPAIVLSLLSLSIVRGTTSLGAIFSFDGSGTYMDVAVWTLAGGGLFLSCLVDLSRMPVDDPTTHLELTMIHEAMIIEYSGRGLAFTQIAYLLKQAVLLGLVGQCFLHSLDILVPLPLVVVHCLSLLFLIGLAFAVVVVETFFVKLKWTKIPEFIAYAVTLSLLGCGAALLRGGIL